MQAADIKIGTSGWKFDDWAGTFYPLRVPQTKWLEYYAARFPVGEINSSYYRIPPRKSMAAIAERTPEDFRLFAKVHADVTHARTGLEESMKALRESLSPVEEAQKLMGLLAQFPASFRYDNSAVSYLESVKESAGGIPLCVEFRHRSWENSEALAHLNEMGVTWVSVDEPPLPDLMSSAVRVTSDTVYLRLHGRNSAAWYDKSAGDRYDYDYSAQELAAIGTQLLNDERPIRRAFVFFNNCYHGQAPRNAKWLTQWLAEMVESSARTE